MGPAIPFIIVGTGVTAEVINDRNERRREAERERDRLQKEAQELIKGIVDESYPTYLKSLDNLSELYFYINDKLFVKFFSHFY